MPTIKGVSHIELSVRDAEQSADWYRRVFGAETLTPIVRPDWGPGRVTTLLHPEGFVFGLLQHEPSEDGSVVVFRDPDNIQLELMYVHVA